MMANGCKPIRILRAITISALLLCAPVGYAAALIGFHLNGPSPLGLSWLGS